MRISSVSSGETRWLASSDLLDVGSKAELWRTGLGMPSSAPTGASRKKTVDLTRLVTALVLCGEQTGEPKPVVVVGCASAAGVTVSCVLMGPHRGTASGNSHPCHVYVLF